MVLLKKLRLPSSVLFVTFLGALILGVFFVSLHVSAQSTGTPTDDDEAENIPELLRVEDLDASGKQFKTGSLRVGSAQIIDITSRFEVLGDFKIDDSLLVAAAGSCTESTCAFNALEGQKFPAFLVRTTDDFVGIGTNDNASNPNSTKGALGVFSGTNEFPKGAVYATSTSNHAISGHAQANQKAGIYGVVSSPYSYAVFGKAVDINNNGVSAQAPIGGTIAAYFKGNVLITGGFLQGNASGLIRVGSLNDASLPAADGGRGIGVWATRQDIAVNAGQSLEYALSLSDGEVLRAMEILVANQGTDVFRTYATHSKSEGSNDLVVSFNAATERVTIQNNGSSGYVVRFVANIETGVSIQVTHDGNPVSDHQPVLFQGLSLYELTADVSASAKNFTWQFVTSPARGQLCESDSEGLPVNCKSTGSISGATIFYKQPADFIDTPPAETIRVKWEGGVGNITRDVTIELVDLTPTVTAVPYGENTQLGITSKRPATYSGSDLVVYSAFTDPRAGESISPTGLYNPPDEALFTSYEEKATINAVYDNKISFSFDIYIVPKITVVTRFPDGPQANQETSTVGINKDLQVELTYSGLPGAIGDEYKNAPATCTPSNACLLSINSVTQSTMQVTAAQTVAVGATWQPPASERVGNGGVYPGDFSYTVTPKEIYGTQITSSGGGTGSPKTITFTINGYQHATPYLSVATPLNTTSFNCATCNPHIGSTGNIGTPANQAPNISTVFFSTATAGTYQIIGRNPNDFRDTSSQSVVISGSTPNCSGCSATCKPGQCSRCDTLCPFTGGDDDSGTF